MLMMLMMLMLDAQRHPGPQEVSIPIFSPEASGGRREVFSQSPLTCLEERDPFRHILG